MSNLPDQPQHRQSQRTNKTAGSPTRYSGTAITAATAALLGAFSAFFIGDIALVPILLSSTGVVLGLVSRKQLQQDKTLGGAGASAAGAIIGAIVLIIVLLPWLLIPFANVVAGFN
ncbi:hypothetical protein [Lysinibacter sp. HNR]|uniref:hypothetical protein n=1 Tax=Lysinibacter sp. HNR TaxID=3031408 RepID=UPI002434F4FB|nr:hypothetical protein [Lysinibacter sp. HNR]WGD38332.1 hypothetical protein FrondiHNR_05325 [Lysinibacter sp. HNR]